MQLVGTLASGVAGAEGGYAKILVRGSSKRARYFTDFEGDNAIDGSNVLLDEHGGAVVYVNVTVDVLVYNDSDLLVRRWIESSTAACVEVVSQSFTGADYETGVGGVGLPTTVASVFDRLIDSFGAPDFLVGMPDGTDLPLDEAIETVRSVFFNVQSPIFGATGDGSTPDGAAIQLAIDAAASAGGGTVFFPGGTYSIGNTQLLVPSGVSILGAGANAVSIVSTRTVVGESAMVVGGSSTVARHTVQGIRMSLSVPTGQGLITVAAGSRVSIINCVFTSRNGLSLRILGNDTYVVVDSCDFYIAGGSGAIDTSILPRRGRVDLVRCRFTMQASSTGTVIVAGGCVHMAGCLYDGTLSSVSNVVVFRPSAALDLYGSARGCEFIDSGGRPIICMQLDDVTGSAEWFSEDGNFLTKLNPASVLYSGTYGTVPQYYCRLGSRESRSKSMTSAVAVISITQTGEFGIVTVRSTFAGSISISPDLTAPMGARLRLIIVNGDTLGRTLTFGTNARGGSYVMSANEAMGFELVRAIANNGAGDVAAWYVVGTSGPLVTGADSSYTV